MAPPGRTRSTHDPGDLGRTDIRRIAHRLRSLLSESTTRRRELPVIYRPETLDFSASDALVATATVTDAQPTEVGTGALARVFDQFDAEVTTTRAIRPAVTHDLSWTIFVFHLQVT